MITWNTAAQTLLDAAAAGTAQVEVTVLLYIGFTVPQRYVLNSKPKDWGGYTWAGVEFGIQPIDDSADARNALGFSFPGVTSAELSLALAGDVEGTPVDCYVAIVDPADGTVADAKLRWSGQLDVPGWQDGAEAAVHFTAEHLGDVAARVKPWYYTNDAQQRLASGDTFLDVDMRADSAGDVWPAASFYQVTP